MKRLDQLTFTRFLAILVVLFYHGGGGIYFNAINKFPFSSLVNSVSVAVSYLYVLSGFVMSIVYYRPNERFDVRGYWRARFVRIYPLYIISFLLVCLYYIDDIARIKAPKILTNIFVLQAWYPPYSQSFNYASWSMTVEFFFYALFPFFTMWAYKQPMRRLIWVSMGIWITSQAVHFFLWMFHFPEWEFFLVYFPLFHLNSFILGMAGGIWFIRESSAHKLKPHFNYLVLAGSLLLLWLLLIGGDVFPQFPHNLQLMAGLFSPIFVVIILSLAVDKTRLSRVLHHPWLIMLGETTYVLYILHVPVIWFFERALTNSSLSNPTAVMDAAFLPSMIAIGVLGHLFVDQPLRRWLKNTLKRVSMPLLLLDLVAAAASIYLSFRFRFSSGKDLLEFRSAAYAMFWCAFVVRIAIPVIFNGTNPAILNLPFAQIVRPVLLSVTAGSVILGALMLSFSSLGWLEGFPRSVLFFDWGLMLVFSTLIRLTFKNPNLSPLVQKPA